jgi:hypothetical protein
VVDARAWRAVRTGGAGKSPYIEWAGDADQPTQAAAPPPPPPPAPVVVQQPAPAAVAAPAVTQPAPSSTFTRTTPAPVKNVKRDDTRELIDQVPSGLRKRFGF